MSAEVQAELEQNNTGFRKIPETVLRNQATGATVYEPPQDATLIETLMTDLVGFIHTEDDLDPLLRMAIAHHQFESIHPFYDGNGRTGRILNLLILQRDCTRFSNNQCYSVERSIHAVFSWIRIRSDIKAADDSSPALCAVFRTSRQAFTTCS